MCTCWKARHEFIGEWPSTDGIGGYVSRSDRERLRHVDELRRLGLSLMEAGRAARERQQSASPAPLPPARDQAADGVAHTDAGSTPQDSAAMSGLSAVERLR